MCDLKKNACLNQVLRYNELLINVCAFAAPKTPLDEGPQKAQKPVILKKISEWIPSLIF